MRMVTRPRTEPAQARIGGMERTSGVACGDAAPSPSAYAPRRDTIMRMLPLLALVALGCASLFVDGLNSHEVARRTTRTYDPYTLQYTFESPRKIIQEDPDSGIVFLRCFLAETGERTWQIYMEAHHLSPWHRYHSATFMGGAPAPLVVIDQRENCAGAYAASGWACMQIETLGVSLTEKQVEDFATSGGIRVQAEGTHGRFRAHIPRQMVLGFLAGVRGQTVEQTQAELRDRGTSL